jgi:hypothetical protein
MLRISHCLDNRLIDDKIFMIQPFCPQWQSLVRIRPSDPVGKYLLGDENKNNCYWWESNSGHLVSAQSLFWLKYFDYSDNFMLEIYKNIAFYWRYFTIYMENLSLVQAFVYETHKDMYTIFWKWKRTTFIDKNSCCLADIVWELWTFYGDIIQ